jgi:hypothetical protein
LSSYSTFPLASDDLSTETGVTNSELLVALLMLAMESR